VSQPPNDPTRAFHPPPQQYTPPVSGPYPPQQYSAPAAYYPPGPPQKRKSQAPKVVGIVAAVIVGVCLLGTVLSVMFPDREKASGPSVTTKAPAAPLAEEPTGQAATAPEGGTDEGKNFNLPPGTTMTITGEDGSVMEATMSGFKVHKGACGRIGADPDNGSYLIAEVRVVQKKGTGFVNPIDFTFVSDSGETDNGLAGALSGCLTNSLGSTAKLRAGSRRSGQIAFDVKDGKGAVEYAPGGLGADTVGSWKTS